MSKMRFHFGHYSKSQHRCKHWNKISTKNGAINSEKSMQNFGAKSSDKLGIKPGTYDGTKVTQKMEQN